MVGHLVYYLAVHWELSRVARLVDRRVRMSAVKSALQMVD